MSMMRVTPSGSTEMSSDPVRFQSASVLPFEKSGDQCGGIGLPQWFASGDFYEIDPRGRHPGQNLRERDLVALCPGVHPVAIAAAEVAPRKSYEYARQARERRLTLDAGEDLTDVQFHHQLRRGSGKFCKDDPWCYSGLS